METLAWKMDSVQSTLNYVNIFGMDISMLYASIYVCMHLCVHVHSHVCACMCINIHMFVCACACICVHACVYMSTHACMRTHACVCVCCTGKQFLCFSSACSVHHTAIFYKVTLISWEKVLLSVLYVHVPIATTSCQRSAECDVS